MADRILVVDDEKEIRDIVTSILNSARYACKKAGSGTETLAALDAGEQFDLMLSDLTMGDLDGIGRLGRTRSRSPIIPAVMVAAIGEIPVVLAASRNVSDDYLLKPFERE